ncbi:MAG TPA: hypothetical protein VF771_15145, partial [Longimicrobiaceae bacterium]
MIPPESVTARLVITCRYGRGPVGRGPPPPWPGVASPAAPAGAAAEGDSVRAPWVGAADGAGDRAGDGARRPV